MSGSVTVVCGATLDGLLESDISAASDDKTAPGLEIGTVVVSREPDSDITTGTDTMEGLAPLFEGCAKAVEMAPPEIGTDVTRVVSERDIVTGIEITGDLLVVSTCSELGDSLVAGFVTSLPSSLVVGFGSGCWSVSVAESLC